MSSGLTGRICCQCVGTKEGDRLDRISAYSSRLSRLSGSAIPIHSIWSIVSVRYSRGHRTSPSLQVQRPDTTGVRSVVPVRVCVRAEGWGGAPARSGAEPQPGSGPGSPGGVWLWGAEPRRKVLVYTQAPTGRFFTQPRGLGRPPLSQERAHAFSRWLWVVDRNYTSQSTSVLFLYLKADLEFSH